MNSFLCFLLLIVAVSAATKPQWAFSEEVLKPASWNDASVSYASPVPSSGYWPSLYRPPPIHPSGLVAPKNWYIQKAQHSAPVLARSDASEWQVEPASWSDASYAPQPWASGFYSAGLPVNAKVEKPIVAKKVVAPLEQAQPVADPTPKLISYSSEISHEVPAKKEEVSPVVPAARPVAPAPQLAPVSRVVSAPAQYSAWAGEVKPSEVKPASWASDVKPASWVSEVKPASWASEVKPASWASEVKPASWSWAEPKPASWAAWAPEAKPASWSSWSEPKPWSSYVSPIQPAYYGASWAQPAIHTNAHQAIVSPWESTWSSAPVSWAGPIQKRSERKPF